MRTYYSTVPCRRNPSSASPPPNVTAGGVNTVSPHQVLGKLTPNVAMQATYRGMLCSCCRNANGVICGLLSNINCFFGPCDVPSRRTICVHLCAEIKGPVPRPFSIYRQPAVAKHTRHATARRRPFVIWSCGCARLAWSTHVRTARVGCLLGLD